MPIITRPLKPDDTGQAVADLHQALVKYGAPIADAEKTAKKFGDSTLAAVLEFRKAHGLPPPARDAPPFDASVARLLHTASAAVTGDRLALRTAVRESIDAERATPPQESYWLARYAVLAGDYALARRAATRAPDLAVLVTDITAPPRDPLTQPPRPPEVPYPENFYTYRYNLIPQDQLDELLGRTATDSPGSSARQMSRPEDRRLDGEEWPRDPFDEPEDDPPPGPPEPSEERKRQLKESADAWFAAVDHWQLGNNEFKARRYASAASAYTTCQQEVLTYFYRFYADVDLIDRPTLPPHREPLSLEQRIGRLVSSLARHDARWNPLWQSIQQRRFMLSLQELGDFDWGTRLQPAIALLTNNRLGRNDPTEIGMKTLRQRSLDRPMVMLAAVFVPLARAEANRMRRQYDAAERDLRRVLTPYSVQQAGTPPITRDVRLTCDFIERPFARLLLGEVLLDKADVQYKARTAVSQDGMPALQAARTDYTTRFGDPNNRNQEKPFQAMEAARTYLLVAELFKEDDSVYLSRVNQGTDALVTHIKERLAAGDTASHLFRALGKAITIPTIRPIGNTLPGTARGIGPHEPFLMVEIPVEQPERETNPRVYAMLLQAQARLLQLWSWLNYLGYSDEYVPPWRFMFLLERARYFADHAKNAQREYLNFLSNAEREEFQELTASQNVEMEKSNVNIETARVDQVRLEVAAASESAALSNLTAENAHDRLEAYEAFDEYADRLMDTEFAGFVYDVVTLGGTLDAIPGVTSALESLPVIGGLFSSSKGKLVEAAQRELEKHNLGLAEEEARQAARVAAAQLEAAQAGLVVAGLQRQAALLRHEFALQNLQFLRNRILNAELWYRLSSAIRSVADTYLRYGIEMAFLAEQAYEFEADKRMDVIRFDYDVSELGDMLAGDFLLRDLDTLEQDLIVGQRLRQQQVKYVLSLSREFPEALQELRDNGVMTFTLRLEQLERRFPGLFNLRISSVEVLPFALMEATRFSLALTHLGTGLVRLRAQPGTPPESPTHDWLSGLEAEWSVKIRSTGADTAVYSGLTRQEQAGIPSFFASNERGAFEGLPGASSWRIDLSMKENRVVPDSLADVLMTFTLSGYYDANLRDAVDHARRKPLATTTWFSGHQSFPDAYYQFNRTGRMDWTITSDVLVLQGSLGELHNVAVLCVPSQKRPELGRMMCSYPVEFEVDDGGTVGLLRELPTISFTLNGLVLDAVFDTPAGSTVTLDFGDGTGLLDSTALPHTYARAGRYEVLVRIAANGRLTEYRAAVVVSRQHSVLSPCIAVPVLPTSIVDGKVKLQPSLQVPSGESLAGSWRIDGKKPDPDNGPVTFTLDLPNPGQTQRYVLHLSAVRPLSARFYSQQRHVLTTPLAFDRLHLTTNRKFDVTTGNETTVNLNAFGQYVFGGGVPLAPTDRWTLDLPLDANPCLVSVSSIDTKQHDLGELSDVFLALEYVVKEE